MKKTFTLLVAFISMTIGASAQVVINEIDIANKQVEIKNIGSNSLDLSTYQLCKFPLYASLSSLTSESVNLGAGEFLTLDITWTLLESGGELALYASGSFSSTTAIVDFVQWGANQANGRQSVAVGAGIWTNGEFVSGVNAGESIEYDGIGDAISDYDVVATGSMGQENASVTGLSSTVENSFSVFPNPTMDVLNLSTIVESAKVYNELGEIEVDVTSTDMVDVSALENGSYFVETITNGVRSTTKFVKQ